MDGCSYDCGIQLLSRYAPAVHVCTLLNEQYQGKIYNKSICVIGNFGKSHNQAKS